jgi:hypothetical protein
MRIAAVGLIMLTMQTSGAFAQALCNIDCPADRKPFASCKPSSLDRPLADRIGIVGRIVDLTSGPNCMGLATVEVAKASAKGIPSQIRIEYDPCERWGQASSGTIDFYVWQRTRPGGAYSNAPCPG